MPDLGVPELLIVAVIVLLLFGPGKASDIGSALGKSIREFRKASTEDDDAPAAPRSASAPAPADMLASSSDVTVVANGASEAGLASSTSGRFCTECGTAVTDDQKFCTACGTSVMAASN